MRVEIFTILNASVMGPVELVLTSQQRAELTHLSLHSPKPYLRERAAGLLKIADGQSGRQVAACGLLRRRRTHTVYGWVRAFKERGLASLSIKPGRGRKPAFSPPHPGRGPR
jgi:hypothetical protein